MTLQRFIRLAAISAGGFNIGLTLIVLYAYFLAWRRSPPERGLIPRYVTGVATFAVMVEVIFTWAISDLIRRMAPLTPLAPAVLVTNLVLTVSLLDIFRFERRRVNLATTRPEPANHPHRRAEDRLDARWWGRRKARNPPGDP